MIAECVAYTFEQSKLNCVLHSSIEKGQKYTRGKQTGFKKPNFILSLPEISYCSEINRKRRCRSEPKCSDVDCLRNAHEIFGLDVPGSSISFSDHDKRYTIYCMNFVELNRSKNGYDVGYVKDDYDCNTDQCECAHFDQAVIGK